jgi:hypothetical protein
MAVAALATLGAGALALESAEDQGTPACCAKRAQAAATETAKPQKMRCSLTGKVVDKCCCVQREGKTHCTLADKDVATCCCTPVPRDEKKS